MTARPGNDPPAPYVGLRPFEFHEAPLFYGRGEHIAEMVRTLRKGYFLAVVGSSGSGKSSLVRAGLLPAIAAGFMDGGDEAADWRFVIMRPGLDPYENLLRELLPQVAPGQSLDSATIEFRRQTLRGGPRGLIEAVADSLLPEPVRLVVLVDQFEEIFRFLERGGPTTPEDGSSLADRRNATLAFVDMLLATTAERDQQVYVVLTMRSEYLGECEAFLGLSAAIAKSQFLTPRMTREQIQDIIERPIQAVGGRIEPQVVTDLLNSLGTAQDQLPRVEHILLQMWNRVRETRKDQPVCLTPDDYREAGGFESALNQHADQLYGELGPGPEPGEQSEKQRVAEQLFRSLAVRSSQGTLVRRFSSLGEVASIAGVSEQVVAEVVEHFRQPGCNFLVATPQTPLTGKTTLDISHEALLRQWAKLGKWLDEEAKSAADYCRLEADARSWQKKEKGFLQSPELDISLQEKQKWTSEWARRYGTDFDLAMRYLKESEAEKERRDAEAETRRNELAAERARAAQAAQKVARYVVAVFVAIGMTLVIAALALIAWEQRKNAKEQTKIATAQNIAARAYQLRDERLDTMLLLATEAHRLATEAQPGKILPDTFGTLVTAAYYNPRVVTYLHSGDSPINAVAFSQNGKLVATGAFDGKVELWDAKKHRVKEEFLTSENSGLSNDAVRAIAFSADGRYMAVSRNSVWLRDLVKGENRLLPPDAGATPPVYALAFSSDSKLLAYGDKKGNIVIRDMMADSAVTLRAVPESPVRGLSFDKDAKVLAAGCSDGSDGRILIWNRQVDEWVEETDRELVPEPADKNGAIDSKNTGVQCLMVSSDGRYLAVGRNSGALNLYDLSDHSSSLKPVASAVHGGFVTSLAFAPPEPGPEPKLDKIPDSERLITSSYDGSLQLWEITSLKPVDYPMTGHVGRVFGVAFSGDSRYVASGGEDGCAILWDTKENVAQTVPEEEPAPEFNVAFSPDGVWEAYGYKRKETEDRATVHLKKHDNEFGEKDWPVEPSGEERAPLVTFSGDGHRLATTMPGGPLRVYDLTKTGKGAIPPLIKEIPINPSPKKITSIGLSQDGSRIAAGFTREGKRRRQATIWNVATGVKFDDLPGGIKEMEDDDILVVQFSPDGTLLVIGAGENAVIWWIGGSEKTKVLARHTGKIRGVAFSPDGKTFVTASGDTTLILWDKDGHQKSPPLTGHKKEVVTVAFSHDGKWLASGSRDRLVILWDVETGRLMGRLFGHTDTARALAFEGGPGASPKTLYSGSFQAQINAGDGGLIQWNLDPAKLEEICRDRANRNASTTEWTAYIRTGKYHKTWPDLPEEPIPK